MLLQNGQHEVSFTSDWPFDTVKSSPFQRCLESCIHIAAGHNMRIRLFLVMAFLFALLNVQAAPTILAEFPFQFREGLLWIKVNVPQSQQPLNFLVDTGSGVSVINLTTAKSPKPPFRFNAAQAECACPSARTAASANGCGWTPVVRRPCSGSQGMCHL